MIKNSLARMYREWGVQADYELFRTRTFIQLPLANLSGSRRDTHHIDYLRERHLSILYYVLDADGDTVIYDNMYHPDNTDIPAIDDLRIKAEVTPKQGRAIIFDGYHWHTGTQPEHGMRCVINSNLFQK